LVGLLACWVSPVAIAQELTADQAHEALTRAIRYFRENVSAEGGYLWKYRADLKVREGEGTASPTQVWVQPPGTPAVGQAILNAYLATNDPYYLKVARDAGQALIRGQLNSGGWNYVIEFAPEKRNGYAYRVDKSSKGKNVTTLDDNNTQSALRFLMRLDAAQKNSDPELSAAIDYGLNALVKAQYPNGAWPQRYEEFPDPEKFPVRPASYPETWSRTFPKSNYYSFYTLNDNTISDVIDTLLEADRQYREPKYRAAALKGGDFFLLAQMPDPQPGWAQQYDADMHPAWARKFEPPAITGSESQNAMKLLLRLYEQTGDAKYLQPLPKALAYYRTCVLKEGRLARFYELQTNRPLYFNTKYELGYDDSDLPTHYGFKVSNNLDQIAREYERLKAIEPSTLPRPAKKSGVPSLSATLRKEAKEVVAALDAQGRWLERGHMEHSEDSRETDVLDCRTFIQRVETLSRFLAASRAAAKSQD